MADVTRAFEQLSHSAAAIQQLSRPDYVTLNASTAFNNYWIMPRLADLQAKHPGIDLRLQSSDREPDIDAENISLAVRRGDADPAQISPILGSDAYEFFLESGAADICVQGEGDLTLPELLDAVDQPERWDDIQGITFLRDGKLVATPVSELLIDNFSVTFNLYKFDEDIFYL